ncbi:MAG: hypothetical protein HQL53_10375 [Magnetococcales bacterium]|nr:hypothetical protein [Magnetococcales bacterium]
MWPSPTPSASATGATTFNEVQFEESVTVPSSPIKTSTAEVSRATEVGNIKWPLEGNHNQSAGMAFIDFLVAAPSSSLSGDLGLISLDGNAASLLYLDADNGQQSDLAGVLVRRAGVEPVGVGFGKA